MSDVLSDCCDGHYFDCLQLLRPNFVCLLTIFCVCWQEREKGMKLSQSIPIVRQKKVCLEAMSPWKAICIIRGSKQKLPGFFFSIKSKKIRFNFGEFLLNKCWTSCRASVFTPCPNEIFYACLRLSFFHSDSNEIANDCVNKLIIFFKEHLATLSSPKHHHSKQALPLGCSGKDLKSLFLLFLYWLSRLARERFFPAYSVRKLFCMRLGKSEETFSSDRDFFGIDFSFLRDEKVSSSRIKA